MTTRARRILAFGTYPIKIPRHGGQRRCVALGLAHRRAGHHYAYACAFDPHAYPAEAVTAFDYPVAEPDVLGGGWAGDVQAGLFCAENEKAFAHFVSLAEVLEADTFVLEHPFMWPLVRRLLDLNAFHDVALAYSSHNVEAPLKGGVLRSVGVPLAQVQKVVDATDALEREVVARCDLTIAVSEKDAAVYRDWRRDVPVIVLPNGINPLVATGAQRPEPMAERYALFVGSAHLPNRDGFVSLVVGEGLQYLPLTKCVAVAGGVADLIYHDPVYQGRLASNGERAHFFPSPNDAELAALIENAHVIVLPIQDGGGTNLKTAEALLSGKWVIGTTNAFHGYERFTTSSGVRIANTRREFAGALRDLLAKPPIALTPAERRERDTVTWASILRGFDVSRALRSRFNVGSPRAAC